MMQCIEKLKEIDLHEISAKTKIATKKLDDIFECRFDNIDRTRVKGFLYILQREYKIDMSEWLEKYDEYHSQKEVQDKEIEESQVKKEKENINISFIDTTMENKAYKRLLIVFVALLVLFVIYFVYNNVSSKTQNVKNQESLPQENLSTLEEGDSSNATTSLDEAEVISSDKIKALDEENSQSASSDKKDSTSLDKKVDMFGAQEAVIVPKSPLWVGIIDLQTYKKKQVSIAEAFSIELDNAKIIRTGHGYFDIKSPQLNKKYIGGDSKYFIYTREDGFREISREEFLGFNRGQEW